MTGLRLDDRKLNVEERARAWSVKAKGGTWMAKNLQDEVTLQCDASDTGLGAVLLQLQQPVSFASRALTQTETRYAQIEKELLAIVFTCEKFDKYIFGQDIVNVETDHKPLEEIFKKSLCDAPARLQRMLLRLQRYNLKVRDTLPSEEVKSLEVVDHTQIEQESVQDPVCTNLRQVILEGWPGSIHECDPVLHPFFQFRDALIVQGNLVFRGPHLFVPSTLRKEFMSLAHSSHIGLGGCLRRLRECMF
ncbi:Retrovirus-related Pol polyprotein from transposon 297 [Acropora cervicornis]|uniref:Retrovirus-related Pol polyprotein from transposon 297 n=1 Tax=Acropora cervicornis TaxID=6130 RepID=A0AAD9UVY6_ACRCE|nr:Retrovirus-related Pol polyprotein from transposon 297 [Acropora cervicornis]